MYFVGGLVFYGDSMGTKASVTETCIASCCLLVVAILKYLLCLDLMILNELHLKWVKDFE